MSARVWVLLALSMVVAGCNDHLILAPARPVAASCRPPAELTAMVNGTPFALGDMRTAVVHAGDKMTTALASSADLTSMRQFLTALAGDIAAYRLDDACRDLTSAYGVFKLLPNTSETLPDRDGIRLILALTSQALTGAMGL